MNTRRLRVPTLTTLTVSLLPVLALLAAPACSSQSDAGDDEDSALESASVCSTTATWPNAAYARLFPDQGAQPAIGNFTSWPTNELVPGTNEPAMPADVLKARTNPDEARANIASRFGSCKDKMATHLASAKPNVYIYFTGFGAGAQNNSMIDEPAILKWLNQRDPKGLIFSISWNCARAGDGFCAANAKAIKPAKTSPEWLAMERSVRVLQGDGEAQKTMAGMGQVLAQQSGDYDPSFSHSLQLAAQLVDQLLVADQGQGNEEKLGKIHFLGYSMGAHAAADILVQDFTPEATTGYKWTRRGVCENGQEVCTVAELKKVNWALGLGTPGWSEALKSNTATRTSDALLYKSGGMLRIADARFKGKLAVFNRRMDPTSTSDDTFQRGFGDVLYGDYNHYSHDYSLPLFVQPGFVNALDAFLESKQAKSVEELGIYYDNAGLVDFDDCKEGAPCAARNNYLAHAQNRSHQRITVMQTKPVPTTDGVKRADRAANRAVSFTAQGAAPVVIPSMDQEDLRGAVELYYRPTAYDPGQPGQDFGIFSYGKCAAQNPSDELAPVAYVSADGQLVFGMGYQGQWYEAKTPAGNAKLSRGRWTHLAFTWDLPVESLTHPAATDADLQAAAPGMAADVQKYGVALVWANGLRKPLATTYNRQKGQGTLRIYANGQLAVEAPLGKADSRRECLTMQQSLPGGEFDTGNDGSYPAYLPYANVVPRPESDAVNLNTGPVGTRCKAYKVRNMPVVFGCAHSAGVNAGGDMDELLLVYGKGREHYDNVSANGEPKNWPIGANYSGAPFKVR